MKVAAGALIVALAGAAEARAGAPLAGVKRWGYQLQGVDGKAPDLAVLAASPTDLLVIDHANGSRALTAAEVERLKARPGGASRRLVVAYLSVGEAEDYRWYWKPEWSARPPPFLAKKNRRWKGNYKVRYWDPEWQRIVLEYVDRIVAQGFDGAYLDIIDAYELFGPEGEQPERPSAAKDMAQLVASIGRHARKQRASFLVIPQNGAGILEELGDGAKGYLDSIDAIGAEDTFYSGDARKKDTETLRALERFRDAGKPVLAVDYPTDSPKVKRFIEEARAHGFVPYAGVRELDRLVEQPGAPR